MAHSEKLSLLSAIIININIMLGSGIFINTAILTQQAGSLGAFVYLIVGILLLPLIMTIARLLHYHQESGTFYDFGRSISPFFGFISAWSYFTGKMCSAALGVHVCLSFLQMIFPVLQALPIIPLDCMVLLFFAFLNTLNLKAGSSIQYSFIFLKLIPTFFVILTGFFFAQSAFFTYETARFSGIPLSVPLVLYAFSGFEASCSLSRHILEPKKNGPLAILISFSFILTCMFLFQLLFYGTVGPSLGTLSGGYLKAFPAFLERVAPHSLKGYLETIMHIAIASSSLGAAYGMMYSNVWNLYTLAKNNHIFASSFFLTRNAYGMPLFCVIAEALLAIIYIIITQGNQLALQQVSALAGTIAYTFSSVSLLVLSSRKGSSILLPLLGLGSCFLLINAFIWTITVNGPTKLLMLFIALLMAGSFMFYKQQRSDELDIFEKI